MKRTVLYDKAKRMYVEDYMTYEAIGEELGVSERTVRNWAADTNPSWEEQRNRLVSFNESLTRDAQEIALLLGQKIKEQLGDGKEPASHIMHSFARISTSLLKIREYEKTVDAEAGSLSDNEKAKKNAAEIFRQTFGVDMPEQVL